MQDVESWEASSYGLNENELQANIIMPEFDGVVHGVPLAGQKKDGTLVTMVPIYDNIKLMAKRAYCWAQLKLKQNKDKRIALIFIIILQEMPQSELLWVWILFAAEK